MTLERNPRYHRTTQGNVKRVTLRLMDRLAPEHEALYVADEVDVLSTGWSTAETVIERLRRRLPAEYSRRDRFVTTYYWLDPDRPPLSDRRLRQAMAMAVDRDAVSALWMHGLATRATGGFVPPGMPGHIPGLALPLDPDGAARLVAEVAASGELPEITLFCLPSREPTARQLAASWRAAGIPIRLQSEQATGLFTSSWESTTGPKLSLGSWVADYPDPDTFLRVCTELDLPNWRHNRLRNLLGQAARTTDPAARLASYQEVERILTDEAVLVPLTYNSEHLMIKPWVTHYPSIPVKYAGFWEDIIIGPDQHQLLSSP
jgi:ABC-type transport system substrate-binding protein